LQNYAIYAVSSLQLKDHNVFLIEYSSLVFPNGNLVKAQGYLNAPQMMNFSKAKAMALLSRKLLNIFGQSSGEASSKTQTRFV